MSTRSPGRTSARSETDSDESTASSRVRDVHDLAADRVAALGLHGVDAERAASGRTAPRWRAPGRRSPSPPRRTSAGGALGLLRRARGQRVHARGVGRVGQEPRALRRRGRPGARGPRPRRRARSSSALARRASRRGLGRVVGGLADGRGPARADGVGRGAADAVRSARAWATLSPAWRMSAKAGSRSDGVASAASSLIFSRAICSASDRRVEVGALGGDVRVGGGLVAPLVGDGRAAAGRRGRGQRPGLASRACAVAHREHGGVVARPGP